MAEVQAVKRKFVQRETQYKTPVTERHLTKVSEMLKWLEENCERLEFNYNGNYSLLQNCPADGMRMVPFDSEICGISITNIEPGTSGTTAVDLLMSPGCGVAPTSIMSVTPSVNSTGSAWSGRVNYLGTYITPACTGVSDFQATFWDATPGEGIPVSAGSFLVSNLDTAMEDGKNANMTVWIRRC